MSQRQAGPASIEWAHRRLFRHGSTLLCAALLRGLPAADDIPQALLRVAGHNESEDPSNLIGYEGVRVVDACDELGVDGEPL